MKLVLKSLVIFAGAAAGLAVGFALRGNFISKTAEPPLAGTSVPLAKQIRVLYESNVAPINDDSPLATKLERDLSISCGVTRWLYWLEAVEKAAPADFPRLLRLAQANPAAMRLVETRWVEVAPRHLFDAIVAASNVIAGSKNARGLPFNELAQLLFDEWPRRDPDAVIAALNEAGNSRVNSHWRFDVAYGIIEKDIERGLRLLSEWHADNVGFGTRGLAAVARWTRADPRHAAEFILEQPDSYSIRSAMEPIGNEWAKTDPAGALGFATNKPGELGSILAASVLKYWAGRNLNEAADWLAGADDRTRNRLGPALVEVWAKQDSGSALAWCETNLTGSAFAQSAAGVLRGAAEKDVAAAASVVAAMDPSQARVEAAVAVAEKWFPPGLSAEQPVRPEAVAWLANLDADSVTRVLDKVSWSWATSDADSMAAFLSSLSSERVPQAAYIIAARELARRNPTQALEWANQLPQHPALTAGGEAFAQWRSSQPEAAMKWWNDLAPDDARRQPLFQSAIRFLAYESQAAEQLAAMNPTERATARRVIETMTLPEDRRTRLLDALKTH